uniref:LysM domain-containing protein n=1 Tax=Arundo donax TaxID=35708 RepID=A0A0A8YQP5_ARUDO
MGVQQVLLHPYHDDDDGSSTGREGAPVLEVDQSRSPPPMSSCGRYILHRVCRFDTLAGVAIKYGVEVADVKRVNGLTTDLQMFAHKTLRIPLPGRHPPAAAPPSSSPGDINRTREWTTRRPPRNAASLDPFSKPPRSAVSPSISLLQGYYGLTPPPKGNLANEGTEMATYTKGHHRKARSLSSGFSFVNGDANKEIEDAEKPIRRRQKAEGELTTREDNGGSVLARAGQRLALRPKSGSRSDMNNSQQDLLASWMPSYGDGLHTVKKSSSSPEFQDSDSISIASVWLKSNWSLKPDAFTLPLPLFDGIPKPLFDSIPKPLFDNIRNPFAASRNKAAKD